MTVKDLLKDDITVVTTSIGTYLYSRGTNAQFSLTKFTEGGCRLYPAEYESGYKLHVDVKGEAIDRTFVVEDILNERK